MFQASGIGLCHLTLSKTSPWSPEAPSGIHHVGSLTLRCAVKAARALAQQSEDHRYLQRSDGTKCWGTGKRKNRGETKTTSGTTAEKTWPKIDLGTTEDSFRKIKWKRFSTTKVARMRFTTLLWDAPRRRNKFSKLRDMLEGQATVAISVPRRNHPIFSSVLKTMKTSRWLGWLLDTICSVAPTSAWVWWLESTKRYKSLYRLKTSSTKLANEPKKG